MPAARLAPYFKAAAAVAAVGVAVHFLTRLVPLPHVSVVFLAAVVTGAALWGLGPSLFAAFLSVAAGSYFFYSPVFSFRVARTQDIADLAVFVVVAILTSRLAAGARARALEAKRQEQLTAALYAFSERLAACRDDTALNASILAYLAPVVGAPVRLLLPGPGRLAVAASQGAGPPLPEHVIAAADRITAGDQATVPGWWVLPLASAQGVVGVIAAGPVAADASPPAADEHLRALLAQAAIAIERARLGREIADARARAQGEALREALINSVSHDLQTPLAAILGSATTLETFADKDEPHARRELAATIREEAERLASYIGNVLDLTRIRAGQIAPRLELVELSDIINAALRRKARALSGHAVEVAVPPDLPMLRLDLFLMEQALANVLDNAAKYSPPGSKVSIVASEQDGEIVVDVADCGVGVRPEELERVFEPFYRAGGDRGTEAPGSGLGLAICRAFVAANGGSATVISAGAGRGTTVRLRLPLPAAAGVAEAPDPDD
jgi:two-component system sensor histidine kinase KdpD